MNVLEKILNYIDRQKRVCIEIDNGEEFNAGALDMANSIKDFICKCMGEAKDINVHSNAGWIDRKNLKEEIESLRFAITGMRNGKTVTNLALEEYRKSILRIIDEQPTYMDDGWIPVDEKLPENLEKVLVWYEYFRYGEYNCMFETYGIGWQLDGYWSGDVNGAKARCIAWQQLPERYEKER